MKQHPEFDIVVYGATGFTGRLIADHLLERYGLRGNLKWAMAGRSMAKLIEVRDEVGAPTDTPLIVADAADLESLRAMAERTKAVITAVGPFQLYGSLLVQACVETGTDYLDLAGEPNWMRQMIDAHEDAAKQSGARILFSCGFDSIPSELGVWYCQQIAKAELGAPLARIKGRLRVFKGGIGGGSFASGKATREAVEKDPSQAAVLMSPFGLTPGFEGPPQPPGMAPENDPDIGDVEPFFLAMINTKNVHRANMLMGFPYCKDFVYDEMIVKGPDGSESFPDVDNLPGGGPKPGEGPSKEQRDSGRFEFVFIGVGPGDYRLRVAVQGAGDPGFRSTSRMIAETAICLINAPDVPGGIWTPVAALQQRLFDRLSDHAELTFTREN